MQKTVQKYSYYLNDILGEGYSSKVYKGINIYTNQVVAIKVINFQTLTTPISQTLLRNEIKILQQINHPNLMRVFEIFESANNTYLVCEFCKDGDLANILEKSNFTQYEIMDIFAQIAQGIKALHDKKIIHRDIKPANILKSNGVYKLADFGFAIVENEFESIIKKFNVGTPVYMSPETVQFNQYSEKSDIWSLGIVLYLMVYKELPFNQQKDQSFWMKQQGLQNKLRNDKNLTKKLREIIIGMLEIDASKRFTIEQVIQILSQTKKLNCTSHQSIPCKLIRRSSAHELLEKSSGSSDSDNLQKVLKTLPDEVLEDEEYQTQNQKGSKRQIIPVPTINKKLLKSIKQNQDKPTGLVTPEIKNNHILKLNNKQAQENSGSQQHSNPNSTKDTITNAQFSNCQSQQQGSMNSIIPITQINEINLRENPRTEPKQVNQSLRHLIQSPITHRKQNQPHHSATQKQPYHQITLSQTEIKQSDQRQRVKTDQSTSKFSDQKEIQIEKLKKLFIEKDLDRTKKNQKEQDQVESLSATIRPTYKFLIFLNDVIKNFESIDTEEKQKCFFLLRKLQAVKADAIHRFCPENAQEVLRNMIEQFQKYYQKVQSVFSVDKKFSQYFNNNLGQFTKGFSQLLFESLKIMNHQFPSKDLQIIQEVINENLKHFNDPILFARRWENDQLTL